MRFLDKSFRPPSASLPAAPVPANPAVQPEPYLTETVVFGMHRYRSPGEDSSVYFVDDVRGIRKLLVDSQGNIQNFPGIVKEAFWMKEVSPYALKPQIRFRTEFTKRIQTWIMLWQIQPDGRYWADDDGFGMENEEEVILYTYIDMDGNFTGPFRIYEIGSHPYTMDRFYSGHLNWYEIGLRELEQGTLNRHKSLLFPYAKCLALSGCRHMDDRYTLASEEEAREYWKEPLFAQRLTDAAKLLLSFDKPITEIAEPPYDLSIQSCMTLFSRISGAPVFQQVLDKFYNGEPEPITLRKLF